MVSSPVTGNKRYNMVTVVTFDYLPFFLIFLNSLFKNVKHELIQTLYVVVDKLPQEFLDYLASFEKIKIISDTTRLNFSGAHGDGWKKAVGRKLVACQAILAQDNLPLILLDSDILFVEDISDYVHGDLDVIVTHMRQEERHVRRDGLKINFIGSAVVFNKQKGSLDFIEKWLRKIDYVSANFAPPHETPALNLLLEEEIASGTIAIGVINDQYISADQNIYEGTRVIHLKTWGPSSTGPIDNFLARISRREWAPEHTPANYLDALCYERWLLYQLGYVQEAS